MLRFNWRPRVGKVKVKVSLIDIEDLKGNNNNFCRSLAALDYLHHFALNRFIHTLARGISFELTRVRLKKTIGEE